MANTTTARINPHLVSAPQWLLHNSKKKPFYADGTPRRGELDSPEDISHLVTFEAAVERSDETGYGLGFAVLGGFQFIDLDHCYNTVTEEVAPWAAPIYEAAIKLGAYIELSMSNTGFHIIGYGYKLPTRKTAQGEVYCEKRYCAIGTPLQTGRKHLPDLTPLLALLPAAEERQPERPTLRLVQPTLPLTWVEDKVRIAERLQALDPAMSYPDWIAIGMAIHAASNGHPEGLALWEAWSAEAADESRENGAAVYVEGVTARMWRGFKTGGGVGLGTLIHMAGRAISSPVHAEQPAVDPVADEIDLDTLLATDYAAPKWLVQDLLPPKFTLLTAPPKSGKSYFSLQLAVCVAYGLPFLGRATTQSPVVYFNLEESKRLVKDRAVAITRAHPGKGTLKIRSVMDIGEGAVAEIRRYIDQGYKLVIVDVFANVRDEMSEKEMQGVYKRDRVAIEILRDCVKDSDDVALVVVHHTNKQQAANVDDWMSLISGSNGLASAADTLWMLRRLDLRRTDEEGKEEARKVRKLMFRGKEIGDGEEQVCMMPDGGGWAVDERGEDEVLQTGKQALVLKVLTDAGDWVGGTALVGILEETDNPTATQKSKWRAILARMVKRRLIESDGINKGGSRGYRLPQ